jgi:hypothetical protein
MKINHQHVSVINRVRCIRRKVHDSARRDSVIIMGFLVRVDDDWLPFPGQNI